jgi:hypothetical protein
MKYEKYKNVLKSASKISALLAILNSYSMMENAEVHNMTYLLRDLVEEVNSLKVDLEEEDIE